MDLPIEGKGLNANKFILSKNSEMMFVIDKIDGILGFLSQEWFNSQ